MTVREHLEFTARSYGVSREDYESRSEQLSKMFRMEEKMDSLSTHLSRVCAKSDDHVRVCRQTVAVHH